VTNRIISTALAAALLWAAAPACADVGLPPILTDGMVIQRGEPVPIWGSAAEGEKVTVAFRDKTTSASCRNGKWRADLPASDAGGPFVMTVQGANRIEIKNVFVGDVWLLSGQSNAGHSFGKPVGDPEGRIRMYAGPRRQMKKTPEGKVMKVNGRVVYEEIPGQWLVRDRFPMVGWHFAGEILKRTGVHVGIIRTAVGGTRVHAWTPAPKSGSGKKGRRSKNTPGILYEMHIEPVIPYRIRGNIWWQGESDMKPELVDTYGERFRAMIRAWRKRWGQGNFPFIWVQLQSMTPRAPWVGKDVPKGLPIMRDAQRRALPEPNTAMAAAFDIARGIHPGDRDKAAIAKRLALAADVLAYGKKIEWSGPLLEKAVLEKGSVVMFFTHAAGLAAGKDGALRGFEIRGGDGAFVPAKAEIRGNTVVIPAEGLEPPVLVRYAWHGSPDGNLRNAAGLPASPFVTASLER
jgi:sialate O-acetylesterase